MAELLILLGAAAIGFTMARNFVRRRLRFVDAIHSPFAPLVAGLAAAVLALPFTLLPFVTLITAVTFGIGTGLGTASGARTVREPHSRTRRLLP